MAGGAMPGTAAARTRALRRWWPAAVLALVDLLLAAWWIGGRESPFDAAREPQRLSAQVEPGRIRVVGASPIVPAPSPVVPVVPVVPGVPR